MRTMSKKRVVKTSKKARNEKFGKLIINESKISEILKENLDDVSKWIALTEKGIVLMRKSLDDFYQACLYVIGKAYSKVAGCIEDDSITEEELQYVLTRPNSAKEIISKMLGDAFIVYAGDDKYVLNYLKLREILEAVEEAAEMSP
ncbi:MAG: hypothetical protein QW328_04220 [Nitrososphaerota archaeon]